MIGPRPVKLTARQEREAYALATVRDSLNGVERCQRCGWFGPCDRDHRQGRTAYNTTPANLQLLGSDFGCRCHRWKTENPREALEHGFSVSRHADPAETPAWRFGAGWVLYDDYGGWKPCQPPKEAA